MTPHLNDDELDLLLTAEPVEAAPLREHLASCAACCSRMEALGAALSAARQSYLEAAERPAHFWFRQRAALAEQFSERAPARLRWPLWVAATAAVCLLAVTLALQSSPPQPIATDDADHRLLIEVERATRRTVPLALEPAALIAQELHNAAEARTARESH
jgi:hypothetical protein